jgi:hypothetical protein
MNAEFFTHDHLHLMSDYAAHFVGVREPLQDATPAWQFYCVLWSKRVRLRVIGIRTGVVDVDVDVGCG